MASTVIAVVDDLFFASKIRGTAEQAGVEVRFVRTIDAVIDAARQRHPLLIIVDLHSQNSDPIELARRLKTDEHLGSIPLVGFFSHVHMDLQQRAEAAGFERVMPRSAFTRKLAEILMGNLDMA